MSGPLTFDVRLFGQVLRVMRAHASTDSTRPHLNGVTVDSDAKGLRLMATDGMCLIVYLLDRQPIEWRGTKIVSLSAVSALQNMCSGKGTIAVDLAACTAERGDVKVTWRWVNASPVPYKQVVPKLATKPCTQTLNAQLLQRICGAFAMMGGKRLPQLRARSASDELTDPIVFTSATAKDMMVILMAMRGDGTDGSLEEFLPADPVQEAAQ